MGCDYVRLPNNKVRKLRENYNENLADNQHNNNMHENDKYHSVVGPMIFLLCDLNQVVPASLHIMLRIDEEERAEVLSDMRSKGSEEWEIVLLELGMKMAELRERRCYGEQRQSVSCNCE